MRKMKKMRCLQFLMTVLWKSKASERSFDRVQACQALNKAQAEIKALLIWYQVVAQERRKSKKRNHPAR